MRDNNLIYSHDIRIEGFESAIDDVQDILDQIKKISSTSTIQIIRANGLCGREHILHSINQAFLSFERGNNIAQDIGLEICLRISAQRQITKALDILGIKKGKQDICAIMIDCKHEDIIQVEEFLGKRNDRVLEPVPEVLKEFYDISDKEISVYRSIERVMFERTSLLSLEI
jgi:KEOPS complex subunit Cgi121